MIICVGFILFPIFKGEVCEIWIHNYEKNFYKLKAVKAYQLCQWLMSMILIGKCTIKEKKSENLKVKDGYTYGFNEYLEW